MSSGRLITGWLILLLATGPVPAAPFDLPIMDFAHRDHTGNGGISLDEAVAQAQQQNQGKVLSAETIRVDGRKVHRIKILTHNGRVKRIKIDARTGRTMPRNR